MLCREAKHVGTSSRSRVNVAITAATWRAVSDRSGYSSPIMAVTIPEAK